MSEAPDSLVHLERALAQSAAVIAAVTPAQMELPTPCSEFDVRGLIGHMLKNVTNQAAMARREPIDFGQQAVTGLADDEWESAFEQRAKDALSAWNAPGALEGELTLPFATLPAVVTVGINVFEQTTHAWDLAAATGSLSLLDPELAEVALTVAQQMMPPGPRGAEAPFADAVDVPADAPAYDRLAGFLGRNPV